MQQTLNILNIEDSQSDFLLLERHLQQQGLTAICARVDNSGDLGRALDAGRWDLILTDFSVPRMDFRESFAYLQSRVPELPVILVSGSVGEEQAVELLKMGVWDFVLKDNLSRLVPAIRRSLREAEDRKARLAAETSMRESEHRFRNIFNHSPIAIGIGRSDDGRLVEVNDAWLQLYGFERHEVIGRTTTELNLYVRDEERSELIGIINEYGRVINREVQLRRKSGEIMLAQYSAEIIRLGNESFLQVMVTDITERKRMETELRRSEELYRSLFGNMLNGFAYCRMIFDGDTPLDFIYLSVNAAFEKQTGLKDVVGRRVSEVIPGIRETDPGLIEIYGRVARTGTPEQFEIYVEALKEWFWVSLYSPAREHFVAVFDVITGRKRDEVARDATVELLRICTMADTLPDLMQKLMHYFQKITACEAIGIRLRDGDDFPYYLTRGFSEEFVLAEKCLCAYDQHGELIRDTVGNPVLDCMCGNILCSRCDPSQPFFTARGSFWSNCTSDLLASTTDAERQAKTRNRCNSEGYESVALIPLRYRAETYGLIQFNDRAKGRFTAETIALYEDLVDYVSITLSKLKSDAALRESEQFNLQIINNAEEGVVVYGTDLRYRGWNPYMERLSGLPGQEVIGKHPLELFPFLQQAGVIERLENVLAGQAVSSTEYPFHSPSNGYSGWASDTSSPLKNANGEIIGVIGMVRDITARKMAEESLRKLYAAVDQSPTVVIITDRDGMIEFVNPRFCLTTGYSSEEALGRNPRILKGDTPPEVFRELWATIGEGDVWEGDFHNRKKDGGLYWEHAIISPIRNEFGVVTHFMAIKEDITERKLAAEELQRKNAEIEQFLYIVSHDLRSPLVTVKTFLGYLESDMADANRERISQDLQYIHGAADKMELLLNELLKISRIGRVETTPARVSLLQMLSEVLDTMAGIISERKVEIRLPESDLILFVDYSHLFHIWQNLIENAIKYSRDDTVPRIELGVQPLDGETLFFARDNGIGIDPKYHKKIFGIFEKLDHKSSGAGLGLSMIQRIVEKYGGRVWVESEGNTTGACFYFTLPNAMVKSGTTPD